MIYFFPMETVVAFDIGDRRIGVACTDPFGEYAMPSDTYFRTGNFHEDVRAVAAIAREKGAVRIVCGLPLNADGTESVQSEKTRRFVRALSEEAGVPVEWEDERFTTREARGDLNFLGVTARRDKRKKQVDSIAAAYILESYLAKSRERSSSMKEERTDYEEEEDYVVELVDEEGVTTAYEHIMTFEYKGEWYIALTPHVDPEEVDEDDDEGGEEIAIYHLVGGEDDETLEVIEDEDLLDEVFAEFNAQYEDFEDAEEAAKLDGGEE